MDFPYTNQPNKGGTSHGNPTEIPMVPRAAVPIEIDGDSVRYMKSVVWQYGSISGWFNGHDSGTDWLEVPTIYKVYDGLCKGYVRGYTPKIWSYMVQYLHFRILEFPLNGGLEHILLMGYHGVFNGK